MGRIEKNWQGKVAAVKSTFVTRVQTCLIVYHKGIATKRVRETSVVTAIKLYSFLSNNTFQTRKSNDEVIIRRWIREFYLLAERFVKNRNTNLFIFHLPTEILFN